MGTEKPLGTMTETKDFQPVAKTPQGCSGTGQLCSPCPVRVAKGNAPCADIGLPTRSSHRQGREQRRRNHEVKSPCRLELKHQLEFGRLLERQLAGLGALRPDCASVRNAARLAHGRTGRSPE